MGRGERERERGEKRREEKRREEKRREVVERSIYLGRQERRLLQAYRRCRASRSCRTPYALFSSGTWPAFGAISFLLLSVRPPVTRSAAAGSYSWVRRSSRVSLCM